jgi:L-rhamnose mutarotase
MSNSVHDLSKKQLKIYFTSEEDQIIRNIVAEKGPNCWEELRGMLKRRPSSIRNRYNTYLRQPNNDKPWSIEEEQRLINLMKRELQKKWSKLEQYFPGRTHVQIKNTWNSLVKKLFNEKPLNDPDSTINMHNLSQQVPTDLFRINLDCFQKKL